MTQSLQHFHARVLRVLARSRAALSAWAQPETNPFLQKALRIEARKHKPIFTVAIVALLSFVACLLIWLLWQRLQWNIAQHSPRTWQALRLLQLQESVVNIFGENPIGWFALATAWVCALGVLWSTRARAAYLLRQELIKNTLVQLQQLPIAEERWIWLMSAHPTLLSLLIWLGGLPMYLLAVFTGQWSALDIAGLLLLFLMLGHAAPMWMPAAWQQQSSKTPNKLTWQQWREMVKQQQAAAQSGDLVTQLEGQRRLQRALGGFEQEYSISAEESKQKKAPLAFGNASRGSANGIASVFGFIFLAQVAAGLGINFYGQLKELWPEPIVAFLPAIPLTWPLVLARLLVAPLPFFAFALPPIVLVLPLWLATSHQRFVSLASQVSAAETFWTRPRLQRLRTFGWLIGTLVLLLLFGYSWPIIIDGGELARLIRGAPTTTGWAIAAGWTLVVAAAAILAGITQELPFKRAQNGGLPLAEAWHESTRALQRALFFAIAMYFLLCWLGGKSGVNSIWWARFPVTVLAGSGFLLADFGAAALGATLAPHARRSWGVLRFLWFQGLGLVAFALVARGFFIRTPFSFDDAPFVLLSPFVTVFSLFRTGATQPFSAQPMLWVSLGLQVLLGCVLIAAARRAMFAATSEEPGSPALIEAPAATGSLWQRLLSQCERLVAWPFNIGTQFIERIVNAVGSWHEGLLRWGERIDNPVLTYELRRRIRKENWIWQWFALLLGEAIVFCLFAQPWQLWTAGPARTFGIAGAASFADWGSAVTIAVLILMALVGSLACLGIGRAFDADRANGTTVFLFLTPQTDRAILIGKWLAGMIYITGIVSTGVLWLAIGILAAVFMGDSPLKAVLALVSMVAIIVLVLFASLTNLFFASRAKKPTEGQGWALLTGMVVELVFLVAWGYYLVNVALDSLRDIPGEMVASAIILSSLLHHGVLAYVMWRLALRAFVKRRYGDVEASAKGAN